MAKLNRRQILKGLGVAAAGGATGLASTVAGRRGVALAQETDPKFLIVVGAGGGSSIIDSFLAIRESESANGSTINAFPDREVTNIANSPFRAVSLQRDAVGAIPFPFQADQRPFVTKHKDDLLVATTTGTSVNHTVAQRRSITGNEIWNGRTLQEAVAKEYGAGFLLPNVNMGTGGYIQNGTDPSIPSFAKNEPVANALVWPLSLSGSKGLKDMPSGSLIDRARAMRDGRLDPESTFDRTFGKSARLELWKQQRAESSRALEVNDLISKMVFVPESPATPLAEYGLIDSPDAAAARAKFPDYLTDPLEAQAVLAYLLIKNRASVTVTISPSFGVLLDTGGFPPRVINPPLAFDFSHNAHRAAQAIMWGRLLSIVDGLIDLLKAEEYAAGQSFWDRSLIYMATEFGRSKRRPENAQDFGSSHHLNNGVAIFSPLVNGNTVLGGVDPDTGLTYGFDPATGAPDRGRTMTESEIFAGILQALEVDTSGSGLPDMRAMRA